MVSVCMPGDPGPLIFDATVIAHLFMNLQYVKQKKIMVFRDLFSVMLTHWGLPLPIWSPVLFCALRRSFSNRMPVQAMLQQKGVHFQREPMLPLKMNAFAHFVFKKTDSTNQHRSYHARPRLSIIFLSNTVQKRRTFALPFVLDRCLHRAGDNQLADAGVTAHAPVTGSWVYVAAGTVICPAVVANRPVVPS